MRFQLVKTIALASVLSLSTVSSTAAQPAQQTPDSGAHAEDDESTTTSANDADGASESNNSDPNGAFNSVVAAPPGYEWSLDVGYGSSVWRSAASSTEPRANPRIGAVYRPTDLWSTSLRLDWSRHKIESGPLTLDNQHWRLLGGAGITYWVDAIHMEFHFQGGALLKTAAHRSPRTDDVSASVIRPTLGGSAALGIGFFERVVLSLTGGLHWSAPARLQPSYGVRLSTALNTGN